MATAQGRPDPDAARVAPASERSPPACMRHGVLTPERLQCFAELAGLGPLSCLALSSRGCHEAVQAAFGARFASLSEWARVIWAGRVPAVRDAAAAAAAASPPLSALLRRAVLDSLVRIAAARNCCPGRVSALCYTKAQRDKYIYIR